MENFIFCAVLHLKSNISRTHSVVDKHIKTRPAVGTFVGENEFTEKYIYLYLQKIFLQ